MVPYSRWSADTWYMPENATCTLPRSFRLQMQTAWKQICMATDDTSVVSRDPQRLQGQGHTMRTHICMSAHMHAHATRALRQCSSQVCLCWRSHLPASTCQETFCQHPQPEAVCVTGVSAAPQCQGDVLQTSFLSQHSHSSRQAPGSSTTDPLSPAFSAAHRNRESLLQDALHGGAVAAAACDLHACLMTLGMSRNDSMDPSNIALYIATVGMHLTNIIFPSVYS
jgi:hypothetical protein